MVTVDRFGYLVAPGAENNVVSIVREECRRSSPPAPRSENRYSQLRTAPRTFPN